MIRGEDDDQSAIGKDVRTIGPKFGDGGQKWHGGVVGKDGAEGLAAA
eukprot:s3542_g1.t1